MLNKRIIGVIVIKDGAAVQSLGFSRYLPIGKPHIAAEYLDRWGIDEIMAIDISATRSGTAPDNNMIARIAEVCRVPLTVGGGINSLEQVHLLMNSGADKIAVNTAAIHNKAFIQKAASVFGSQCIVTSVDVREKDGKYFVFDHLKKQSLPITATEHIAACIKNGAGEILVNAVDRDGSGKGFDIPRMKTLSANVKVPVIALGGAANAAHFDELFTSTSVAAAAAANMFHYTEHSVSLVKGAMTTSNCIRRDTAISYNGRAFGADNRLLKRNDKELEELLFVKIKQEII